MNRLVISNQEQNNTDNRYLLEKKAVNTNTLMKLLDCGKATAIKIGHSATAEIRLGRKVLWNVKLIQKYLDDISE